jgi:probable phosphoglycerate mutase
LSLKTELAWPSLFGRAPGGEGFRALCACCRFFPKDLCGPAVLLIRGVTSRVARLILLDKNVSELRSLPADRPWFFS